jgi:hypothetical protein
VTPRARCRGCAQGIKHWADIVGAHDLSTLTETKITDAVVGGIDTVQRTWQSLRNAF